MNLPCFLRGKNLLCTILTAAIGVLLLPGCSSGNPNDSVTVSASTSSRSENIANDFFYIDPDQLEPVLEEIYEACPELLRESIEIPTQAQMQEQLKLDMDTLDDYYIRRASGSYGVADIYLIKPGVDKTVAVYDELEQIRQQRRQEFEEYDVYNALAIVNEAEIHEIGSYLVMILMENEDTVLEQLRPIIPIGE